MDDVVSCSCTKCDNFISDFDNVWHKFGKGHYMPISASSINSGTTGLQPSQDARKAAVNTVLEDSYLQDLSCKGCGEVVGLKCHNAPQGHILKKDQILLRLKRIKLLSRRTGKAAQMVVQKSHELKNKDFGSVQNGEIKDGLDAENDDTRHFRKWAEDSIREQGRDIDRISASMERIESDMQSFKDFMVMVRTELANRPTRSELDAARVSITESIDRRQGVALSSEDLELMTDSISKIGSRVSEVDTLKLEVQLLKSRIKRFEENDIREAATRSDATRSDATRFEAATRSDPRPLSARPFVEQRVANSTENSSVLDPKRRRISGQYISDSDDESAVQRSSNRSRSASRQKGADGERPKRKYQRRARSPTERGYDENGFPLTANGERDKRYKSGKFAGRRPTAGRRPYGTGVAERREREGRSGSRDEMTRSEEREEQRRDEAEAGQRSDAEEEQGDRMDGYEEEAELMGRSGEVERGRKEAIGGGQEVGQKEEREWEYPDPEAEEAKRRAVLEKRERLVVETLEREMRMDAARWAT